MFTGPASFTLSGWRPWSQLNNALYKPSLARIYPTCTWIFAWTHLTCCVLQHGVTGAVGAPLVLGRCLKSALNSIQRAGIESAGSNCPMYGSTSPGSSCTRIQCKNMVFRPCPLTPTHQIHCTPNHELSPVLPMTGFFTRVAVGFFRFYSANMTPSLDN